MTLLSKSIKTVFLLPEMKPRYTGTQCANLFIIISTTVARDGLSTSQKLDARSVSIDCLKTVAIVTIALESFKLKDDFV